MENMVAPIKRRALVLTDDAARHPFRSSLPPHVRLEQEPVPARKGLRIDGRDWRDFFSAYCASFVAVTTFLA